MDRFILLFVFIGLIISIYCNTDDDDLFLRDIVRRDKHTKFILFGSRHGNRNPTKFLNESHGVYGFEGSLELTAFGKRQSYAFGRELRSFLQGYLSGNFNSSEAEFYTSSASRTQMTLQAILAGLYPPRSYAVWNLALDWTPVPYTIDDPMLRMYSVACPESKSAWQPIDEETLETMMTDRKENELLLNYIGLHTGWDASLASAADLADNLDQFELHNLSLPDWLDTTNFTISENDTIADEIMKFQEYPQIQCARYTPCRNLMSGVWLEKIADTLERITNSSYNKDEEIKIPTRLMGFVSHTEIVMSILLAIGIDTNRVVTTGGFIIEVRDEPTWEARILMHEPLALDEHIIFKAKYSNDLRNMTRINDWIPVSELIDKLRENSISNWPLACGIEKEDKGNVPSDTDKLIVDVLEVARMDKIKNEYKSSSPPILSLSLTYSLFILSILSKIIFI